MYKVKIISNYDTLDYLFKCLKESFVYDDSGEVKNLTFSIHEWTTKLNKDNAETQYILKMDNIDNNINEKNLYIEFKTFNIYDLMYSTGYELYNLTDIMNTYDIFVSVDRCDD